MRTTAGIAQQVHLVRAARTAGEAFAFIDHEETNAPRRAHLVGGVAWALVGLTAAVALYIGL
jgi:hypothetical protein